MKLRLNALVLTILGWQTLAIAQSEPALKFERIVIDADFPGGYQVEVADVNGDKKPDIVALGGSTIAWYENPSWKKRVISTGRTTHDIISSATTDLDGDGKAEIAIAFDFSMNEPKRGELLLATQGKTSDDAWTFKNLGSVPSIHRLRWGNLDGLSPKLVIAPIFGPDAKAPAFDNDPARLMVYRFSNDKNGPPKLQGWDRLAYREVMHAIEVTQPTGPGGRSVVYAANKKGVTRVEMVDGMPKLTELLAGTSTKGASEVHIGKLGSRAFVATIEPWHGTNVVVHFLGEKPEETVLDTTLDLGHALWVADVDGDGNDEVFAGHRGKNACVSVYHFDGKTWHRQVLDPKLTAQDLRGGDIDGDGTPDVVAIGGASKNVVWFKPVK